MAILIVDLKTWVVAAHGGLITPAIPDSQWPIVAQKNQIGFVSLIVRVKTLSFDPEPVVVIGPLQNPVPLAKGAHGASKEDWVTE